MRRGSIVGVNGSLADITSNLAIKQPLKELASTKPVLYQHVSATSPATLLVADSSKKSRSHSANRYTVINVDESRSWTVGQRNAILGWNSAFVKVEAKKTGLGSMWKHWGNVSVSGTGQLVLVGDGDLFQIDVGAGEDVLLNPSNVIAYTDSVEGGEGTITRLPHLKSYIELPTVVTDWLEGHKLIKSASSWLKTLTTRLLWRDDISLKLKGPRRVILQTEGTSLDELFTKTELMTRIANK
ncbi:hypothetical protein AWJ20_464 [Sugiyamaella lignohabitans]|uniref:Altered inheritance of mitochondria protein 24, mitochondrial n=1 Tax=Sugiyamaella lignohabitans TaxID=796027 RepID=A0A167CX88_9ASCO|nr:uncharacterized protein AWJ20_464 [Sugiyamaella lignohabitans]ANB12216.1 hypothetical protein AWJ20_464 [Sugiyamaella lignohabitans]